MDTVYIYSSPLGDIEIESDGKNLTGLRFQNKNSKSMGSERLKSEIKNHSNIIKTYSTEISHGRNKTVVKDVSDICSPMENVISDDKRVYIFKMTCRWLDIYFSGKIPDFTPPLLVRGTDFQRDVCSIICRIPYGKTCTYSDIASEIASERGIKRMSARAVGGAAGRNPISIIIPCHRVVGADGRLRGYAGGLYRKMRLLEFEKNHMQTDC